MIRVLTCAITTVVAAFMLSLAAFADDAHRSLTADEIDALLRGNTIEGTWSGETYSQYFDANGSTVYLQDNRRPDLGRWRVNSQTNQYESWWEQTGWTPYTVVETEDGYGWKRKDTYEPFFVRDGKHITW